MNKTEQRVKKFMENKQMLQSPGGIVVGVSGGADSVALLLLLGSILSKEAYPITAVHVHHGIRGAEADRDGAFVKKLCADLKVPFVFCKVDVPAYAKERGLSEEEAGRVLRYQIFEEERLRLNAEYIAVAHNKNDLAETMLFHMVRGSNLHGMTGIPAVRGRLVRPLLCLTREQIEAYLSDKSINWCTDSTNVDTSYDRNRIRHSVMPELLKINSAAVEHMAELAETLSEVDVFTRRAVEQAAEHCVSQNKQELVVDIPALRSYPALIRQGVLYETAAACAEAKKDLTSRHIDACAGLLVRETGKRVDLPYGVQVKRSYDTLLFRRKTNERGALIKECELPVPGEINLPDGGVLTAEFADKKQLSFEKNVCTKYLNYDKIKGTLCVRTPMPGDYIIFSERGGKKKLSRIFIDEKIEKSRRETWPVVACEDQVLWVVGLRYNEAYRIREDTERVLKLTYRNAQGE